MIPDLWDEDPLPVPMERPVLDATSFFPPCGAEHMWDGKRCRRCGQRRSALVSAPPRRKAAKRRGKAE